MKLRIWTFWSKFSSPEFWLVIFLFTFTCLTISQPYDLPEIYQDVLIKGKVVKKGVRACADRYEAIQEVLRYLPRGFKALDIGASQGYFSFRMAEDFGARPVMIEDSYTMSNVVWRTGEYLQYLCQ